MSDKKEKRVRGEGRIFRRGAILWIQYYSHGRQIRESADTDDEKKAGKLLRKKIGEVEAGIQRDTRGLRYEDLRASYFSDYQANGRKSLRRDSEGNPYLDKVNRLDGYFCGFRASEISSEDVRKFIVEEQKKELTAATINRSLAALKRMFRIALRDGRLRNVPYIPMLREAAPRSGFFERAEFDSLYRELPGYLRVPLALGYYTGMRRGEVCGLRWEQVSFLDNAITLNAGETKNDAGRSIPITPQLLGLLKEQHGKRLPDCPFVCFRLNSKGRAIRIGDFRKTWQACCVKLGLGNWKPIEQEGSGSKAKEKMVYEGKLYHDLRRSAVRNLVRAGVPERVAQEISGHKTRSVFARYNIVSPTDVLEAGRKLGAFHEEQVGDKTGTESTKTQQETSSVN